MNSTKKKSTSKKDTKKSSSKNKPAIKDFERGRVEQVTLKDPFTLNGNRFTQAVIQIDHINYGLDKKTYKLNEKKRTDFTIADIEKFLTMLNGEYIFYKKVLGKKLRYEHRIDSPILGKFYKKQFVMVFETDYDKPHLIHTITLFPNW